MLRFSGFASSWLGNGTGKPAGVSTITRTRIPAGFRLDGVRGPSTLHAESPLFSRFRIPAVPQPPTRCCDTFRPNYTPPTHFLPSACPSGPPYTLPVHRTSISYVLDSLTFFLQARSIILLELSILLC